MPCVIVTGADRGIGAALVRAYQQRGARAIAACLGDGRDLVAEGLEVAGGVDVTNLSSLQALRARLGATRIDILISNAGAFHPDDFEHLDFDAMLRLYDINALGPLRVAQALAPAMAATAAHVTIVQRSPTYVLSRPSVDRLAHRLRRALPAQVAHDLTRWKYVLLGAAFYQFRRRFPARARALLTAGVRAKVGPDFDVATHFNPRYQPWDQRLCMVPDADLFDAIKAGRVEVVTDHIDRYTETGLALRSGRQLDADVVVTATGLRLLFLGGLRLTVDGQAIDPASTRAYKGAMLSGVPNLAMAIGYVNASWTLKCELIVGWVCRLLEHMDRHGLKSCVPVPTAADGDGDAPLLDLAAGYVQRAAPEFPHQGQADPWRVHQNYLRDLRALRHAAIVDGRLRFGRAP